VLLSLPIQNYIPHKKLQVSRGNLDLHSSDVVRWMTFVEEMKYGHSTMPSAATFSTVTIFNLSGFINVILVFTTRLNLGLFGPPQPPADIELRNL